MLNVNLFTEDKFAWYRGPLGYVQAARNYTGNDEPEFAPVPYPHVCGITVPVGWWLVNFQGAYTIMLDVEFADSYSPSGPPPKPGEIEPSVGPTVAFTRSKTEASASVQSAAATLKLSTEDQEALDKGR